MARQKNLCELINKEQVKELLLGDLFSLSERSLYLSATDWMQVTRDCWRFAYAEIFERPLARRDERTARPPFVDMRARNPCFLARLRLFGWNVRFVVISSPFLLPLGIRPAGRPYGATAC